ncbi:LolA family protein [Syntrophomonas erecta]
MSIINKTRWIILIITGMLLVALAASAGTIKEYYIKSKLEPQVVLDEAIKKMTAVTSYRYHLKSGFTVDNRKEVISEVKGERTKGNTHIKGEMVNTPIDIYYIDRTIYNYDSFSKKWLVIDSGTTNSEELLISELNPLSNFRFKQVADVSKVGFGTIDGTECLVIDCRPSIESQLLESIWKDFQYRLWIDYKQNLICKAVLTAVNKQTPQTKLNLKVEFKDINQKLSIRPPDTASKKE